MSTTIKSALTCGILTVALLFSVSILSGKNELNLSSLQSLQKSFSTQISKAITGYSLPMMPGGGG